MFIRAHMIQYIIKLVTMPDSENVGFCGCNCEPIFLGIFFIHLYIYTSRLQILRSFHRNKRGLVGLVLTKCDPA